MSTPGTSPKWEVVTRRETVLEIGPWTMVVRKMDTVPTICWWEWVEENSGDRLQGFKSKAEACKSAVEYLRDLIAELAEELS